VVFHPADPARARVGFFTTCVMETMFPRINQEAVRLLVIAGCEVWVPRAQSCCGALQAHAGLRRVAKRLARKNATVFPPTLDHVVTTSAGCGAALRDVHHLLHDLPEREQGESLASRVRDISEVLWKLGLPEPWARPVSRHGPERPLRVGYHDPCHLAHAQKVRHEPRALLDRLPGVERVDLPNPDWCCGSAGIYNLTHPEMADVQLQAKLDSVEAVTPELVVASNPGCMLHMQRGARARGLEISMVHLVEVLGMAYPPKAA
jgi:glycolate oxidase iron-sulfur subunit